MLGTDHAPPKKTPPRTALVPATELVKRKRTLPVRVQLR